MKIALLILTAAVWAKGAPSHESVAAKLMEAVEYEPCDYYCGALNHPTTAYCVEVDGQVLVGERGGLLWFGENDAVSMRNLVGKQILARFEQNSIFISDNTQRTIKIKRGGNYEQFQNTRCLVEVHKPKLGVAAKSEHPRDVPADAFPLAGAQVGDLQNRPLFVWFSCSMDASMVTID